MWLYRLFIKLWPLTKLYWRLGVDGDGAGLPGSERAVIFAPNHSSFLDPWFVAIATQRPIRYLINHHWYHKNSFWTWMFRGCGTIPVKQRDPRGTIETVCGFLDAGESVAVFPEGKISHDGRIQKVQTGLARIAARSGAPVVPVGIRGAYGAFPRHRRVPRPKRVRVVLGEPMVFPGAPDERPDRDAIEQFNARLRKQMARLSARPVVSPEAPSRHAS